MADLDVHLSGIVAGDSVAFARWVAGAEPRVRGSLYTFAARVDTESVVQETLLRVWQTAPRFTPDGKPDGLVRYAVRIARNLAVSEVRRARCTPTEVEELLRRADDPRPAAEPDPLLRTLIHACIDKLPGKQRAALHRRMGWSAQPDAVLCEQVGMTLNTFLQNIRRARLSVAKCLRAGGAHLPELP